MVLLILFLLDPGFLFGARRHASCGKCLWVLLLLFLTFITGSLSSVKVKRREAATLPCSHVCSGRVTWTVFHKQHDILAQCDQTSCQSEEGFHMSHDQYLKGDFSLTITDADFTKRAWYTCTCNGRAICDASLQIEASSSSVQIQPGEPLVLDLFIPEPVAVVYNSTGAAAPSSGQICTVDGYSLQCKPEYTERTSLISAIELRGTAPSDSGVYIIWDAKNEEVLHTYTVTVGEVQPHTDEGQGAVVPVWALILVVLLLVGSMGLNVWQRRTWNSRRNVLETH